MLDSVRVLYPIHTPLHRVWVCKAPESILCHGGLAAAALGQPSDSTAGADPPPLRDPGDRLPGSAAERPLPGLAQPCFPQELL